MDMRLKCKVGLGQFSAEVAVHGSTFDGTEFSLFVPEEMVEYDAIPTGAGETDGLMRVRVLQSNENLSLVRLPGQTFENGRTITVLKSQLQEYREKV